MGRKVRIEVTEEDIAKGVQSDCRLCPIALAIARHTDGEPWVDNSRLCFGAVEVRPPPLVARQFMERFDADLPVTPLSFEVELP